MPQKTWFITGTSSGFGRHMTEQLLARGERVAATARRQETLEDLAQKYGNRLWIRRLDVRDTANLRQVVTEAAETLGRIDVVVSNAGYGLFGAAEGLSDQQIEDELATNLMAPIQLVRAFTPILRAQGGGRILQISTYGGQVAMPGGSLYHASKWGAEGFFESMAKELASFNIGVTIVEPGGARTGFRSSGAQVGEKLAAYANTPVAHVHKILEQEAFASGGDPAVMAAMMIEGAEAEPAPLRLVLGSDAYGALKQAIAARLAEIEPQGKNASRSDIAVR
jgi:NAD(P)-dependent dehydrogenase (short-subunit alcohol dehydrogenase family)